MIASSAWLGSATPEGWLWKKTTAAAIELEGTLYDDTWMNRGAVDGALEHLRHLDDPVAVVEEQRTEHLVLAVDELQSKERPCLFRAAQRTTRTMAFGEHGQRQFDHGFLLLTVECSRLQRIETIRVRERLQVLVVH
ncbi:MAG: hypothetical protein M9947_17900 [Thermomicrobiales bacterium]|nr:hypothetical protein [Thermomicrobiales bacterium]